MFLFFFGMVITLFALCLGPDPKLLASLSPAIIWVAVVLSLLLSLETLFRSDFQEGGLEQFVLSLYPLPVLLLGKLLAHWLAVGLPLLIIAPVIGKMLKIPDNVLWVLWLTLLLGIPTLSLIGSIAAALIIGLSRGGMLLTILGLPLMVPVIILAGSAIMAAGEGSSFQAELLLMGAFFIVALILSPLAISAAVRVSIE